MLTILAHKCHERIANDLNTISAWAYQWKMVFNPDITKQAVEVIFCAKNRKIKHPELTFNDIPVAREDSTQHLGLRLDNRLNFSKHIKEAVLKPSKGVTLCVINYYVQRHLNYGELI